MVDRRTPAAFSIIVFRRASTTASPETAIRLSRSVMSVRTKTMPVPVGGRTDGQAHALAGVHAHARADGGGDQRPFVMIVAWRQG